MFQTNANSLHAFGDIHQNAFGARYGNVEEPSFRVHIFGAKMRKAKIDQRDRAIFAA
jgi:hypothetical protein